MKKVDIIKAWKDPEYRASLSAAERATLPDSPAGAIELSEDELEGIAGGVTDSYGATACCKYYTVESL